MYGFVLLSLLLTVLALNVWPPALPAHPWLTVAAMGGLVLTVFLTGLALSGYIVLRRERIREEEQRFLRRVGVLGKLHRLLVIGCYAAMLFYLPWPSLAGWLAGRVAPSFLLTLLVMLVPLVVLWLASWTAHFWAETRMKELLFPRAGVSLPQNRWTLGRYLVFMFRQYVLVVTGPLVLLLGVQDAMDALFPARELLAAGVTVGVLLVAVSFAGPWMRLCWKTDVLPESDLRGRLQALADRADVRIGNMLVWRTNQSIGNGAMVGLVGPLRYIMITDALMLGLPNEEIEAVFAHEVAHVKYHHVPLFIGTALGAMGVAMLLTLLGAIVAGWTGERLSPAAGEWLVLLPPGVFLAAFWWLGFGWLSRRCETESDLYAMRATSCPVECSPPVPGRSSRVEADRERSAFCEHRFEVLTGALQRIARLNGSAMSSGGWRHPSVAARCRFLAEVLAEPEKGLRYERFMRRLKVTVFLVALFFFSLGTTLMVLQS